jgi:hypothetical protein
LLRAPQFKLVNSRLFAWRVAERPFSLNSPRLRLLACFRSAPANFIFLISLRDPVWRSFISIKLHPSTPLVSVFSLCVSHFYLLIFDISLGGIVCENTNVTFQPLRHYLYMIVNVFFSFRYTHAKRDLMIWRKKYLTLRNRHRQTGLRNNWMDPILYMIDCSAPTFAELFVLTIFFQWARFLSIKFHFLQEIINSDAIIPSHFCKVISWFLFGYSKYVI